MIIASSVSRKYYHSIPYAEEVQRKVVDIIGSYCRQKGYLYTDRIKTLESTAEKIESGRFRSWNEIGDLYAGTVVVPTLSHEHGVIEFVGAKFDIVGLKNRASLQKAPDHFFFDASRITCRLRPSDPQYAGEPVYQQRFEIQVQTIFEHAWGVATHDLTYKSDVVDWRRLRLSAKIKATAEQLDMLMSLFETAAGYVVAHEWPELDAKRLIYEQARKWIELTLIPGEMTPNDWSRFCENVYGLIESAGRKDEVADGLRLAEEKLSALSVPRSVSLFQLLLGIWAEAGWIRPPLNGRCAPISDELRQLFPATEGFVASAFEGL